MLAKITSKNQLTLPKSVTEALGPVQYFEVQAKAGQIVLTPVRIQRGDAVRAKLAELDIDEKTLERALGWSKQDGEKAPKAKKAVAKPLSTAKAPKAATRKQARSSGKTTESGKVARPARPARAVKTTETLTATAKSRRTSALAAKPATRRPAGRSARA